MIAMNRFSVAPRPGVLRRLAGGALMVCLIVATAHAGPGLPLPAAGLASVRTLDLYDDEGRLHALLSGTDAGTDTIVLRYLSSTDGGLSWSRPVTVNRGIAAVRPARRGNDFQLAASGDRLVAVWQTTDRDRWIMPMVVAISEDGGEHWRPAPNPAGSGAAFNQGYVDIAADESGVFHIVWLDDREENGNFQGLRYARGVASAGGLEWEAQKTLDESTCTCCWTTITTGSRRSVRVLYRDHEPHDMALVGSADGGASWQSFGSVGEFDWQFAGCPHRGGGIAAQEQDGRLILHAVVWNGKAMNSGLYYLRSNNGGRDWQAALRLHDAASGSGEVAVSDGGRVAVVYTVESARERRVVAIESADGGHSWSRPRPLSVAGAVASHPRLIALAGGWRAFWSERRGDESDVWMSAWLPDGSGKARETAGSVRNERLRPPAIGRLAGSP